MVLGVVTTKASTNEIANLEEVLDAADLPRNIPLKADKVYQSAKNEELLRNKKLKNHILKKAKKNKPLTHWEKKFNKLVGKKRFKVERTFGGIKRWFLVEPQNIEVLKKCTPKIYWKPLVTTFIDVQG